MISSKESNKKDISVNFIRWVTLLIFCFGFNFTYVYVNADFCKSCTQLAAIKENNETLEKKDMALYFPANSVAGYKKPNDKCGIAEVPKYPTYICYHDQLIFIFEENVPTNTFTVTQATSFTLPLVISKKINKYGLPCDQCRFFQQESISEGVLSKDSPMIQQSKSVIIGENPKIHAQPCFKCGIIWFFELKNETYTLKEGSYLQHTPISLEQKMTTESTILSKGLILWETLL